MEAPAEDEVDTARTGVTKDMADMEVTARDTEADTTDTEVVTITMVAVMEDMAVMTTPTTETTVNTGIRIHLIVNRLLICVYIIYAIRTDYMFVVYVWGLVYYLETRKGRGHTGPLVCVSQGSAYRGPPTVALSLCAPALSPNVSVQK